MPCSLLTERSKPGNPALFRMKIFRADVPDASPETVGRRLAVRLHQTLFYTPTYVGRFGDAKKATKNNHKGYAPRRQAKSVSDKSKSLTQFQSCLRCRDRAPTIQRFCPNVRTKSWGKYVLKYAT